MTGAVASLDGCATSRSDEAARILVVDAGIAQLDKLVEQLGARGRLQKALHPLAFPHDLAERSGLGDSERRPRPRRGRRRVISVRSSDLVLAGTSWEVLRLVLGKCPFLPRGLMRKQLSRAYEGSQWRRNACLARAALRYAEGADAVVAAAGTTVPLFQRHDSSSCSILRACHNHV